MERIETVLTAFNVLKSAPPIAHICHDFVAVSYKIDVQNSVRAAAIPFVVWLYQVFALMSYI